MPRPFLKQKRKPQAISKNAVSGKTVGFGDSATLQALNLHERLATRNEIHSPMLAAEERDFLIRAARARKRRSFSLPSTR